MRYSKNPFLVLACTVQGAPVQRYKSSEFRPNRWFPVLSSIYTGYNADQADGVPALAAYQPSCLPGESTKAQETP